MSDIITILKSLVGDGEIIHTHGSTVLITEDYVYKIKKPVYFGFLDYRQLKQRRVCSVLEKELNSRYSEDIYLEVLKIAGKDGAYSLVSLESSLPAIEYVLKMRRIPDELFLSYQVGKRQVNTLYMESLGEQIALRLGEAEPSPEIVDEMTHYELIKFNCDENFIQLSEIAQQRLDFRYCFVKKTTEEYLNSKKALFQKRHDEGYVKNGHGDLRLEHIYIYEKKLGLIDGIEFNKRFRTNDVVSEAAFLSMEMDYAGRVDLSDAFLSGFFKVYSDNESIALLNFYRCYRSVVRAKVAIFALSNYSPESKDYKAKVREFNRMMDMAVVYARCMGSIRPLVFCGMIATGKSVNTRLFSRRFPVKKVNSDEVRKQAAGLKITDAAVAPVGEGLYSPENTEKTYRLMGNIIEGYARLGRLCIADGTFLRHSNQDIFESELTEKPIYIEFKVDEEEILRRLKAREKKKIVSDGRLHHYESMKKTVDNCSRDLVVSGEDRPKFNICTIIEYIVNV